MLLYSQKKYWVFIYINIHFTFTYLLNMSKRGRGGVLGQEKSWQQIMGMLAVTGYIMGVFIE